jgi:hypothetical protein
MRFPAAKIPISAIVTPASANAAIAASDPRSTMSLSECLPNLVIAIPRIQMSSLAMMSAFAFVVRILGIELNDG